MSPNWTENHAARMVGEALEIKRLAARLHRRTIQERMLCIAWLGRELSRLAAELAEKAERLTDPPEGYDGEGC